MPVKLIDIARMACVSEATASLALNGSNLVKNETKEKIIKLANEYGYLPNAMAKGLAKSKSNTIGLVIPDIEDANYARLVKFIDQNTDMAGFNLVLAISNDNPENEKKIINNFIMQRVEGIIIAPVNHINNDTEYLENLQKHHIPHIFVTAYYPRLEASYVMVDLEEGSYELVKYLLSLGHRNIYFLVGPKQEVISSQFRINGYKRAFSEQGLIVDENMIIACTHYDYESAYKASKKIVSTNNPIDAIIAINDTMALATINAIRDYGLRVPEDISVAGYDDMLFSSISPVPITTVKQDIVEISKNAVDILIKRIKDDSGDITKVFVKPELIIRDSTSIKN